MSADPPNASKKFETCPGCMSHCGSVGSGGTIDLLYKNVLCNPNHNISTKSLGPIALFSVQVSFVVSTLVDFVRRSIYARLVPEASL